MFTVGVIVGIVVFVLLIIPFIISRFLTQVPAGTIRLVSRFGGGPSNTRIYKGPGKAIEVPLLTTGTTIPSKAINIDLDIADQTADVDRNSQPKPIKVRVLASAIVSVGDSAEMITTAANKFFSKPVDEQTATLTDLLTSTGRRAICGSSSNCFKAR
jgi:flotillin